VSRIGIEQLLYQMDWAFEGDAERPDQSWHAVLVNLASSPHDEWDWKPDGATRTIASLAIELGYAKYVYDSHCFGDGSIDWNKPGSVPLPRSRSQDDMVAYLRAAHDALRGHVASLQDDAQLLELRPGPWPERGTYPIRWLVNNMIQHDLYHAGEINHLRALRQGNDDGRDDD